MMPIILILVSSTLFVSLIFYSIHRNKIFLLKEIALKTTPYLFKVGDKVYFEDNRGSHIERTNGVIVSCRNYINVFSGNATRHNRYGVFDGKNYTYDISEINIKLDTISENAEYKHPKGIEITNLNHKEFLKELSKVKSTNLKK